MISVTRVQHAVERAESGTDRSLVIGKRIPRQTDSRIDVVQRWIDACRLQDGHKLPVWRIQKIVLLVPHGFDDARRLVPDAPIERQLPRELPLVVDVHGVDPVAVIFGRVGAGILRIRYLTVERRRTALHETGQVRECPLWSNLEGSPCVLYQLRRLPAELQAMSAGGPDDVISKCDLV